MKSDGFKRSDISSTKRWVIKVGSSLITNDGKGIDVNFIDNLVTQVVQLHNKGIELCIVSSGSIAEGRKRLGIKPKNISELQAAAAVGQTGLVEQFGKSFAAFDKHAAQILLTHEDLADRQRYLNAKTTIGSLLAMQVVPVINENDTVVTKEIQFGDNDTLAALIANVIEADVLVLLTDKKGLYNKDPSIDTQAEFISDINTDDQLLDTFAGESRSGLGRGGMITKVRSARMAARSGANTIIASGREPDVLHNIFLGKPIGSLLHTSIAPLTARRQWMLGQLRTKGCLQLDEGASHALLTKGVSLLPVGVESVTGHFQRGDLVDCITASGTTIARGLVNYSSQETKRILGADSRTIEKHLGYISESELIHRDNLVLVSIKPNT